MVALSEDQLLYFRTFGYLLLPQLLNVNDLSILGDELDHGLSIQFPETPFDGSCRQWTRLTDENTPFSASLMENSRFLTPAQQICGPEVLGVGIDANRYVGDTGWHPDSASSRQMAVKYIFYLDELTAETGALRVIPGSHLLTGQERELLLPLAEGLAGATRRYHSAIKSKSR